MVTGGVSAASKSATDLNGPALDGRVSIINPADASAGFFVFAGLIPQCAALIERSTASLGQQSTLSPADFW
jgi:hypothetical protein